MTDTTTTTAAPATTQTTQTNPTHVTTTSPNGAAGADAAGGSSQSTPTSDTTGNTTTSTSTSHPQQTQTTGEPDAAAMRAYLDEKTEDGKTPEGKAKLDGKTPAELAELYKALKTKEAPPVDPNKAAFKVPDEFKDKPWAAKVTSEAELWKQLANAQELIGKKSIIPDLKTATPEQREEFYKQLRPADASEYVFNGDMANPDVKTAVGKLFMDNGISATQGNAVIEGYMALGEAEQAKLFDKEGFVSSMKGAFGDGWEAVRDGVHQNLGKIMSPEDYTLMEKNLPNAYVGLIYRTMGNAQKAIDNMMVRYGVKETGLAHFADPAGQTVGDIDAVRANLRGEMTKMKAGPHTADQYMALQNKLSATYKNHPGTFQQKQG